MGGSSLEVTAHNVAGKNLTISGGSTIAGTTNNIAGGVLTLKGGQSKGTGDGGDIVFQVANAGSSGSSLNSYATALTISDDKSATFGGNVQINGGLSIAASQTINMGSNKIISGLISQHKYRLRTLLIL